MQVLTEYLCPDGSLHPITLSEKGAIISGNQQAYGATISI